jgi:hypothetical protein
MGLPICPTCCHAAHECVCDDKEYAIFVMAVPAVMLAMSRDEVRYELYANLEAIINEIADTIHRSQYEQAEDRKSIKMMINLLKRKLT